MALISVRTSARSVCNEGGLGGNVHGLGGRTDLETHLHARHSVDGTPHWSRTAVLKPALKPDGIGSRVQGGDTKLPDRISGCLARLIGVDINDSHGAPDHNRFAGFPDVAHELAVKSLCEGLAGVPSRRSL